MSLTTLELIYEGLCEYFDKTSKSKYTKREIMEFLHKTFVFCDFDMNAIFDKNNIKNDQRLWDNYLWMILDYYATKKHLHLTYQSEMVELMQKTN